MVVGRIASSVIQRQVKYVTPTPLAAVDGVLGQVYAQVLDEMGLVVPPVQLHSPVPDLAAAYWMLMREPMLPTVHVDRSAKEAVATAVAVANICPYCVEMHSVGMYDLATERDAEALAGDRIDDLADPRLRTLAAWARQPGHAGPGPFDEQSRAELVGVVVGMHYLTRMVNVFLSSFLLPPRLGPAGRRRFKQGASRVLRPTLRDPRAPGRAVELLPPAELPADAAWAQASPSVAAATARSFAAFEAAGRQALTPAVREVVLGRLESWHGEETGLSRAWCERLVQPLPEPEQAAARLALLTAFASYQVDADVVGEFRRHHPGDAALVRAASWASYTAARRVGSRHLPIPDPVRS
ncbi:carboxymuconolactone decarboxylase family protein [Catellatospora sp. NPDC049111]|uniref:carboxymuconolactone decarboxylase family protein n=1 Tax=Catellatospora sp. NPDC049111 TaxID=3155271 RepID=UPI0033E201A5